MFNKSYTETYICKNKSAKNIEFYFLNKIRWIFNQSVKLKIINDKTIELSSVYPNRIKECIQLIQAKYDI